MTDTIEIEEIRGLSVRRPWAACIASGHKPVENRTRKVNFRGWLAIHAAEKFEDGALFDYWVRDALAAAPSQAMFPRAIIATARLSGCHEPAPGCDPLWCQQYAPWHWELTEISALEAPIFRPGALGLWRLTEQEEVRVREHLHQQMAGSR